MVKRAKAVASTAEKKEAAATKRRRRPATDSVVWRHRSRPVPKWLLTDQELEEMARRRLLMVLSVLSGETPVSDVIAQASISRGTYYQLEEKALRAMLVALSPASGPEGTEASALETSKSRITELEERIKRLERDKRRTERLLYVTRKVIKPGPMKMEGRGRKRGARRLSTKTGNGPLPISSTAEAAKGTPSAEAKSDAAP